MKIINTIIKVIDTVNDYLGRVFSVLVLGILGVILCEVVSRRFFNHPQIWTQPLMIMLFAMYIVLICAYGFQMKAFVAVDVLFAKLPQMAQYVLHLVTYFCYLVPFAFWITPKTWNFFYRAFSTGEKNYSVWGEPTWPMKLCYFIGMSLLCAQTVSEMLKQVRGIVELAAKKPASADGKEAQS